MAGNPLDELACTDIDPAMLAQVRALFERQQALLADQAPVKRQRQRAGRQTLPRIEQPYKPASCACGQCGAGLVNIGEDVSEQLDVEPARFFVHRHIRPQCACRACETVTAAPIPPAVIDGALATPGLLAWVAAGKYLDHLPLYRIEQIAARQRDGLHADETPVRQLDPGSGKTRHAYLLAYRCSA